MHNEEFTLEPNKHITFTFSFPTANDLLQVRAVRRERERERERGRSRVNGAYMTPRWLLWKFS